jgi:hypothetical protein
MSITTTVYVKSILFIIYLSNGKRAFYIGHWIFVRNNITSEYLTIARKGWSMRSMKGSGGFQPPERGLAKTPDGRIFLTSVIR